MERKNLVEEILKNSSLKYKPVKENEYIVEFEVYSNLPVFIDHKNSKYKVKRYLIGYKWNDNKFENYIKKMEKDLEYYSKLEKIIEEISKGIPGKPKSSKLSKGKDYNTIHISFLQHKGESVLISITEDLKKFSSILISKSTNESYPGRNRSGKFTQYQVDAKTKDNKYIQSLKFIDLKDLEIENIIKDYNRLIEHFNLYK